MDAAPVEFKDVPSDFPREMPGALSGAQAKMSVRLIGGTYIAGESEAELYARFDACDDLATELTDYSRRKLSKYPDMPLPEFLRRLRRGVATKGWDISAEELRWVIGRVALAFGATLDDVPSSAHQFDPRMLGRAAYRPVETIVDIAIRKLRG